jgi:hypothetical protein
MSQQEYLPAEWLLDQLGWADRLMQATVPSRKLADLLNRGFGSSGHIPSVVAA